MKNPSFHWGSTLLLAGALGATLAGTSCTAEDELDALDELAAPGDADEDERSGADHDGGECHDAPQCETRTIDLWPPNHGWRYFDVEDCLESVHSCDGHWEAKLLYITSDEPVNSTGDGNTAPDIACDEHGFAVRSERKGNGDGRVYDVHIEVKDHHERKTHVVCEVEVDHDQGPHGEAVDSGDAYSVPCS